MTDLELRQRAAEIAAQFRDETVSDKEIARQIREEPELVRAQRLPGTNLFLEAAAERSGSGLLPKADDGGAGCCTVF